MMGIPSLFPRLSEFRKCASGATAVEFAIVLPLMMLTFGTIVEAARIYWNYQGAVSGVRDASRYLARTTDNDVCGGAASTNNSLTGGSLTATNIIRRNLDVDGNGLFPAGVTLSATTPVSATYDCISVTGVGVVPVAVVDATVEIQLPLAPLFAFFGNEPGTVTSTITDQSRVYGL